MMTKLPHLTNTQRNLALGILLVAAVALVLLGARHGFDNLTTRDPETGRTPLGQFALDLAKVLGAVLAAFILIRAPWQIGALIGGAIAATTVTGAAVGKAAGELASGESGPAVSPAERACADHGGFRLEAGGLAICADGTTVKL
jgi:hypothetical protein